MEYTVTCAHLWCGEGAKFCADHQHMETLIKKPDVLDALNTIAALAAGFIDDWKENESDFPDEDDKQRIADAEKALALVKSAFMVEGIATGDGRA